MDLGRLLHLDRWDSTSLQKEFIWGLFYKEDQSQYEGNKLNMYINPVRKGDGYPTNVDELIKWDTDHFKSKNPALIVTYYRDLPLGDRNSAKVYQFDDSTRGYYMLYGYTTESNCSFVFVLIARSKQERADCEKAYAELLSSFIYIEKK